MLPISSEETCKRENNESNAKCFPVAMKIKTLLLLTVALRHDCFQMVLIGVLMVLILISQNDGEKNAAFSGIEFKCDFN
jgi:hypothetical protein